jgi:hypothetical protein
MFFAKSVRTDDLARAIKFGLNKTFSGGKYEVITRSCVNSEVSPLRPPHSRQKLQAVGSEPEISG